MEPNLQTVIDILKNSIHFSEEEKTGLISKLKETDKKISITEFKLDRTEKVKRTTAILLEETIDELEQKRKAIEEKNHELEIENALEKVRAIALSMKEPADMPEVCKIIATELNKLGVKEIRNVQTAIFYESKGTYMNYEYYAKHDKTIITEVSYTNHKMHLAFADQMLKGKGEFFSTYMSKAELPDWIAYQKTTNVFIDSYIETASSLNYYWYSLGPVALGISTYVPLTENDINLFKRFRNVFELAYRRFLDIEKAEAQAREAQIEAALEKIRSRSLAMHGSDELKEVIAIMFEKLNELNILLGTVAIWLFNKATKDSIFWVGNNLQQPSLINLPYDEELMKENTNYKDSWQAFLSGESYINKEYSEEEKNRYFRYVFAHNDLKAIQPEARDFLTKGQKYIACLLVEQNSSLYFDCWNGQLYGEEQISVLKRVAKVFEQAYIRFLDLQKAEAQARESQIQLALERVRARTMAMQKSSELAEAAQLLYKEFKTLHINTFLCGYCFIKVEQDKQTVWVTLPDGTLIPDFTDFPLEGDYVLNKRYEDWKQKKPLHVLELQGEVNKEFHRFLASKIADQTVNEIFSQMPDRVIFYCANFSTGYLFIIATEFLTREEEEAIIRFAKVFEQTYTRFLDLQKAEAQAREAQIEAALERIRSSAMAMHSSEGILEVTHVLREQIALLGEKELESILVHIYHEDKDQYQAWYSYRHPDSSKVEIVNGKQILEWSKTERARKDKEKYHGKESDYTIVADRKMLKEWYEYLYKLAPEVVEINDKGEILVPDVLYYNYSKISAGALLLITNSEPSQESRYLLKRAAQVFNLAYSRFLDLQKAEAQAREAKIEASLERVRSKAMAMQKSDDLANAVAIVFEELDKLDLGMLRCGIGIINKENRSVNVWAATKSDKDMPVQVSGDESMDIHPLLQGAFNAWLKQEDYSYVLQGEELTDYYKTQVSANFKLPESHSLVTAHEDVQQYYFLATFPAGGLFAFRETAFSEEAKVVMKRFTDVFNLTYTRYNDLQLAEAQTREAKIEAALERVRGKAMGMHNSNNLSVTASMVFTELRKLGINPVRCGVSLQTKDSRKNLLYYAIPSDEGDNLSFAGAALLAGHPVLAEVYDSWIRGEDYFPVLKGDLLTNYYQTLRQVGFDVPVSPKGQEQYGYYLAFSEGMFYGWAEKPFTESEIKMIKRFASVIDLTFRRYMELQKSEASAREAVKQAALDRVRAEIASMRTIDDLERITPLIWSELTILGVAFIRCGVFIMDDANELIHTFLSTPEGKAIAAFHLPYTTPGNIEKVLSYWQHKKNYIDHWGEADFTEFAGTLVNEGALLSPEEYLETIPRGGFYLHFLPFLQGMLYVGNTTQLAEEEIKLIQSVADAFSTAYARYEDFNKLEAAKQQVDGTLVDLKQAQAQLVQSEKMASLGELTAGIAHEIQNPLNFVNNFSEVSNELLDEMKTELINGNNEEAIAIAENIIQNLEKINHHGKRADAIVKGMLQHSRMSSGQKELTDINMLADEYLRLSYHGLRAKDNTFNATIKTDFDNTLEKINMVPQDIGRVILNLYNNAFYALAEKKHTSTSLAGQSSGYEPAVSVSTKKIGDMVEISVSDNGKGITQNIIDKIFQPFFTTKPTGQGTGLGLSLSYDIIKAHGGELKVESKEGEGTTFTIILLA